MYPGKTAKTAGEVIKEGLDTPPLSGRKESWNRLALAVKLSLLCERWEEFAGKALCGKSMPASCEYTGDYIKITINVSESSVLTAAKFRRAAMERKIKQFLETEKLKIDLKTGPVFAHSTAASPLPPYLRRAPVLLSEEEIESEKKYFKDTGISDMLADGMARVKLSAEKLAKRKNKE